MDTFVPDSEVPLSVSGTHDIGTGRQSTVTEVHSVISSVLDGSWPTPYSAPRMGELHAVALDAADAKEDFGWKPVVDGAEEIHRAIQSLRNTLKHELTSLADA